MALSVSVTELDFEPRDSAESILTADAIVFLNALDECFEQRRRALMDVRRLRQAMLNRGGVPAFPRETESIRNGTWRVAAIPEELLDRRVEIPCPPERRKMIDALNSGARVVVADFEDAHVPTWSNCIEGQRNLVDANKRAITWTSLDGRLHGLRSDRGVLFVRPRGWHMVEKHFPGDGRTMSASLFDFGLYLFHNWKMLRERGSAPYFYLPKLESHCEARLWNDVFVFAQQYLGMPPGTIRATVLIETVSAAFEMDEILYELRDHSAGLACGPWNYIFSFTKKFRNRSEWVLPERADVSREQPFLRAFGELLIHTCHKRGIHAIGGMTAEIPVRHDPHANEEAIERVRENKLREVRAGHDGTWVADPALVPVALEVFDEQMKGRNQIQTPAVAHSPITAENLLEVPKGRITASGLQRNIDIALWFIESWLRGKGCIPLYNLMEDAATAEICRVQLWQWIRHGAYLDDGRQITSGLRDQVMEATLHQIVETVGPDSFAASRFVRAATLLSEATAGDFQEFLTVAAYRELE